MPSRRLVLASTSRPRLRLLQAAGFAAEAIPSDVDEDGVDGLPAGKAAVTLAERKAFAVADRLGSDLDSGLPPLVIGCDTILLMDGRPYGKPASLDQARQWCRDQRNTEVVVVTGHCIIDVTGRRHTSGVSETAVLVGEMSDPEIEAYLATGEALAAAGGLTIDGYGAPFITGLRGDHGTVIGLSLPLMRDLLAELDIPVTSLWASEAQATGP